MKRKIDNEKIVEHKLVELVAKKGGLCIKLLCNQFAGLPDRLCLFPKGSVIFVELKTTGLKPRKLQIYVHNKLKELGFKVEIIDSLEGVNNFIDKIK